MVRFAAVAEFQMPPPYLWRDCQLVKEKSHSCKIQSGCFYLLDERFRSHPYAVFQFVTSECFASHGRAAGPPPCRPRHCFQAVAALTVRGCSTPGRSLLLR